MSTYEQLKRSGANLVNDATTGVREVADGFLNQVSNQELAEKVGTGQAMEPGAYWDLIETGFDGVFGAGSTAGVAAAATDWWNEVPTADGAPELQSGREAIEPIGAPASLPEQVFGAPASDFGDGVAHSSPAATVEEDPKTTGQKASEALGGLRADLRQGKVTVGYEGSTELANGMKLEGNGGLGLNDGQVGVGGKLSWEKGGEDFGLGLQAGIDFDDTRLVEGAGGGFEVDLGPAELGAGAGIRNSIGDTERLPDGRFQVTWQGGGGASGKVGLKEGGIELGGGSAGLVTRTFASQEEADAFREELAWQLVPDTLATADVVTEMKPGETFSVEVGADVGLDISPLSIVGIDLGVEVAGTHGIELEKLEGDRVRATSSDGWSLGGKAGIAGVFGGWTGDYGFGNTSSSEVEFDLSQPGVAEVFETFQRTGELPEELPAGVDVGADSDIDFEEWGTESWLFTETVTKKARVEDGTMELDGERWNVDRASREEKHEHGWFWGSPETVSAEKHELEAFSQGDDVLWGTRSTYDGAYAKAHAYDDVHATKDLVHGVDRFGDAGGSYTVDTLYGPDAEAELGLASAYYLAGDERGLHPYETSQFWGMEDMARGLVDTHDGVDMGPIADYFASNGGEAADFLRSNVTGEETAVQAGDRS